MTSSISLDFFLSVVVRSLYFGGDAFFEREVACAARRHDAQYWQPRQVLILRVDDVMNDSREVSGG